MMISASVIISNIIVSNIRSLRPGLEEDSLDQAFSAVDISARKLVTSGFVPIYHSPKSLLGLLS